MKKTEKINKNVINSQLDSGKLDALMGLAINGPIFPNNPITNPLNTIFWASSSTDKTAHYCHGDKHSDWLATRDGYELKIGATDTFNVRVEI